MSFKKCEYIDCKSNRESNPDLHFFRFPVKNQFRCQKWKINAGNPKLFQYDDKVLKSKLICDEHFSQSAFVSSQRNRLNPDAVPLDYAGVPSPDEITLLVPKKTFLPKR